MKKTCNNCLGPIKNLHVRGGRECCEECAYQADLPWWMRGEASA